mmetsp:Transcript_38077/g.43499  ORF Transcript_38077/g.43499 Transcript_38077/m.43499 type:complete len:88 (+) Transcript_38077:2-265(+)
MHPTYSLSNNYMHEIVGDTEISVTKWTTTAAAAEEKEGQAVDTPSSSSTSTITSKLVTRTIEYTHPVNAPKRFFYCLYIYIYIYVRS